MTNPYGPWATAIDAGRNPQLSAFWRQRLTMLAAVSRSSPLLSRHNLLGLSALAALVCALPMCKEQGTETVVPKSSAAASPSNVGTINLAAFTNPVSKALIDAWKHRQESIQSFHFSWLHLNFGKPDTAMTPLQREFQEAVTLDVDGRRRFRIERQGKVMAQEDPVYVPQTTLQLIDGTLEQWFCSRTDSTPFPLGFVSAAQIRPYAGKGWESWPIMWVYRPLDASLGNLDPTKLSMSTEPEIVNGRSCIVLRQERGANNLVDIVWVDAAREFVPVRFVNSSKEGIVSLQVDISYAKDANYGWVPASWKFSKMGPNGGIDWSWGTNAIKYKLNEAIAESTFQMNYPSGTFVHDSVTKEQYILLDNGQKRPVAQSELRGKGLIGLHNELMSGKPGS